MWHFIDYLSFTDLMFITLWSKLLCIMGHDFLDIQYIHEKYGMSLIYDRAVVTIDVG